MRINLLDELSKKKAFIEILRKKLIEDLKGYMIQECPQFNDAECELEAKKIINKRFGVD